MSQLNIPLNNATNKAVNFTQEDKDRHLSCQGFTCFKAHGEYKIENLFSEYVKTENIPEKLVLPSGFLAPPKFGVFLRFRWIWQIPPISLRIQWFSPNSTDFRQTCRPNHKAEYKKKMKCYNFLLCCSCPSCYLNPLFQGEKCSSMHTCVTQNFAFSLRFPSEKHRFLTLRILKIGWLRSLHTITLCHPGSKQL